MKSVNFGIMQNEKDYETKLNDARQSHDNEVEVLKNKLLTNHKEGLHFEFILLYAWIATVRHGGLKNKIC